MKKIIFLLLAINIVISSCKKDDKIKTTGHLFVIPKLSTIPDNACLTNENWADKSYIDYSYPVKNIKIELYTTSSSLLIKSNGNENVATDFGELNPGNYYIDYTADFFINRPPYTPDYTTFSYYCHVNFQIIANQDKTLIIDWKGN